MNRDIPPPSMISGELFPVYRPPPVRERIIPKRPVYRSKVGKRIFSGRGESTVLNGKVIRGSGFLWISPDGERQRREEIDRNIARRVNARNYKVQPVTEKPVLQGGAIFLNGKVYPNDYKYKDTDPDWIKHK